MQNDILFDNIYIGHSVEDAAKLAEETFGLKHPQESLLELADKPKEEEKPKSDADMKFLDDPVTYIQKKLDLFITIAKSDPVQAMKFVPEVPTAIGGLLVTLLAIITLFASGSAPSAQDVKKAGKDAKEKVKETTDKAAEAVATGAEKVKAEATKRSTRSQS
jgi:calnexin